VVAEEGLQLTPPVPPRTRTHGRRFTVQQRQQAARTTQAEAHTRTRRQDVRAQVNLWCGGKVRDSDADVGDPGVRRI
jgi:hypothetical protein